MRLGRSPLEAGRSGPRLGSVPHECHLDECSSLAFGLINNNINSNYCDRLINPFKKRLRCVKARADSGLDRIIVDIISNFMSRTAAEIIKNFLVLFEAELLSAILL